MFYSKRSFDHSFVRSFIHSFFHSFIGMTPPLTAESWILIVTSQPKLHNNPGTKTTNNLRGPIFSIQIFLMLNRSMKSLWGQPTWNQIKSIQLELAEILLDKIPFGQRERQQCRDEFAKGQVLLRDKFCSVTNKF